MIIFRLILELTTIGEMKDNGDEMKTCGENQIKMVPCRGEMEEEGKL